MITHSKFNSSLADFGYDISDYEAIQPEYGTMDDFTALIAKAKELGKWKRAFSPYLPEPNVLNFASGIKIILDYVPNHTSGETSFYYKSQLNFVINFIKTSTNGSSSQRRTIQSTRTSTSGTMESRRRRKVANGSRPTIGSRFSTVPHGRGARSVSSSISISSPSNSPISTIDTRLWSSEWRTFWDSGWQRAFQAFALMRWEWKFDCSQNVNRAKGFCDFLRRQVPHLFEVEDLRDEPTNFWDPDPKSYGHLLHYYTKVGLDGHSTRLDYRLLSLFGWHSSGSSRHSSIHGRNVN